VFRQRKIIMRIENNEGRKTFLVLKDNCDGCKMTYFLKIIVTVSQMTYYTEICDSY